MPLREIGYTKDGEKIIEVSFGPAGRVIAGIFTAAVFGTFIAAIGTVIGWW